MSNAPDSMRLPGRLIIVQPTVPFYRIDFFNQLYKVTNGRLVVYAGEVSLPGLPGIKRFPWSSPLPDTLGPFAGVEWQPGVTQIPITKDDILVVCGAPRAISTLVLLLRARLKRVPSIWWGHFWSSTSKSWRFRIRLTLMRLANAILFYTDKETEEYLGMLGKQDSRYVSALNNGLAVEPIQGLRVPYCIERRESSIFFIGRLTKKSGLNLLIEVLARDSLATARLEVVGAGPEEIAFKELAHVFGVGERIVWHGPLTNEHEIAAVANRSRLFCYPGQVGLSLIHSMAYGLPSVIHNDPKSQMPEFAAFSEGETGWSFSEKNSVELEKTLAKALQDIEGLMNASANAAACVDESFNTTQMTARMMSLVDRIVENKQRFKATISER